MNKKTASPRGRAAYCPNKKLLVPLLALLLWHRANAQSEQFNIKVSNGPISEVFKQIEQQSSYRVFYLQSLISRSKPVTIDVSRATLTAVLNETFKGQPLSYSVDQFSILVKEKSEQKEKKDSTIILEGKIYALDGKPLSSASITNKASGQSATSNADGAFTIAVPLNSHIEISYIGFESQTIKIGNASQISVRLMPKINDLDEVVVMGYGTTSKRMNTGNISKVSSKELKDQPVSNPLAALIGRVPGMVVTQTSGVAGAGFNIQIRGQNSLTQGNQPFIIIDDVPFTPGNESISQLNNAAVGISPLSLINPNDIESIEVLKDADATAIFGSRGANGVVLITTKKGKVGKTTYSSRVSYGMSHANNVVKMLNTQQYVAMRREAFANANLQYDANNAPDLVSIDTTRYTDFRKLLTGNTAGALNIQTSMTGGNAQTRFYLGASYNRETTVMPTDLANPRSTVYFNLMHQSTNRRFQMKLSSIYASSINNLPISDMSYYIVTPPHLQLYDSLGRFSFAENGISYSQVLFAENPMALLSRTYSGEFQNLNSNLNLSYQIIEDLKFAVSLGYNTVNSKEVSKIPSTSIDPATGQLAWSSFARRAQGSWIIEPQLSYHKNIGGSKLELMLGSTLQDRTSDGLSVTARNYSNDALLGTITAAGLVETVNSLSQYRYGAYFGRINYIHQGKYIVNATGRRDGSSRFGDDQRFASFAALGSAWLFSEEEFLKPLTWLDYGKLRISYGKTGNDQIGDYKYLDTWTASINTYQGVGSLTPTALYNPDYAWEVNKKLEIGIELGLLKDRVFFSASYFRNRSANQLISYSLPRQTGFLSVFRNMDAEIQNQGAEFLLTIKPIQRKDFNWEATLSTSFTRNKLIRFPGLESSSYRNVFVIGQPVNIVKLYHYEGIDPQTGLYQFEDVDGNGTMNNVDAYKIFRPDPQFYGGVNNTFQYKRFQFSLFVEFRKQQGKNYRSGSGLLAPPGYQYYNQPTYALDRWQQPGDIAYVQRYSPIYDAAVMNATLISSSTGAYSDASFIRFKTLALSYTFTATKAGNTRIRCFANAQNLFTISSIKGGDPENQTFNQLPPLRTLVAGVELTF